MRQPLVPTVTALASLLVAGPSTSASDGVKGDAMPSDSLYSLQTKTLEGKPADLGRDLRDAIEAALAAK